MRTTKHLNLEQPGWYITTPEVKSHPKVILVTASHKEHWSYAVQFATQFGFDIGAVRNKKKSSSTADVEINFHEKKTEHHQSHRYSTKKTCRLFVYLLKEYNYWADLCPKQSKNQRQKNILLYMLPYSQSTRLCKFQYMRFVD